MAGEGVSMAGILVVDDEKSIRMLFNYVLSEAGYTVKEAENGVQALAVLGSFIPDAILLDIAMPEMRGPEFAANLRRLALRRPELAGIPYLVMTGEDYLSQGPDLGFEKDKGFKGYIPKMTPPEEVLARVGEVLKNRR